ncbi:MAG: alpha/beta fold hydrolase [Actinomycetota bacterium]
MNTRTWSSSSRTFLARPPARSSVSNCAPGPEAGSYRIRTTIAFAHATGFCGAVWRPILAELAPRYATITWDFPNHGSSPRIPLPVDWWAFGEWARDRAAGEQGPVIGVGHSMGGAALVMAELLAPGTFAALILIEPMLFPPPYQRSGNHLSRAVLKRRRVFASRAAARDNFASKPPFASWHPAALDGYIECGLIEANSSLTLACTPEAESDVYEGATAHGAWERAGEVQIPTLVLAGAKSDVYPEERVRLVAGRLRRAGWEILPEADHFLPMALPQLVARRIERMAGALADRSVDGAGGQDQSHQQVK